MSHALYYLVSELERAGVHFTLQRHRPDTILVTSREFGFDKMQAIAEESLQQPSSPPPQDEERRKPTELEVRIFLVGCVPVWLSGALVHYLARSEDYSYLLSDWLFETALHSAGLMNVIFGGAGVLVGVALMKLVLWRLPDTGKSQMPGRR